MTNHFVHDDTGLLDEPPAPRKLHIHVTRITSYEVDAKTWAHLDMEALDDPTTKEIDQETTHIEIDTPKPTRDGYGDPAFAYKPNKRGFFPDDSPASELDEPDEQPGAGLVPSDACGECGDPFCHGCNPDAEGG